MRKSNAKHKDLKFSLTFRDVHILLRKAKLYSSDWGRKGGYDLARYGDKGGYSVGNCRFITHKEKLLERRLSSSLRVPPHVIRRIQALRARGLTWREIANRTGLSRNTVVRHRNCR